MRRPYLFLSLLLALVWLGSNVVSVALVESVEGVGKMVIEPDRVPAGLTPSAWQSIDAQLAKLTAGDGTAGDRFGTSVAIDGDTVIVGALTKRVGENASQGAAYIFSRNQGGPDAWGQVATLTAADGAAGDSFGTSVSLSGDTVIVGAEYADVAMNEDQGAAYVFLRDQGGPGVWGQVAKLAAADGAEGDNFGWPVSVSNDKAIVGAQFADVDGNANQGAAYIFERNGGGSDAWGQAVKLTAADGAAGDWFGHSVSIGGDTAIVGAWQASVDGNANQGAAYVYGLGAAQHTVHLPLVNRNRTP